MNREGKKRTGGEEGQRQDGVGRPDTAALDIESG